MTDSFAASERWLRSFAGKPCLSTSVVGFCNNVTHKGYITKTLLKSHDCVKKDCRYLSKLNMGFWDSIRRKEELRRDKRIQAELQEQARLERDQFIKSIMSQNPHIHVTMIQDDGQVLNIYYIRDRYVDLSQEIRQIREKLQKPICLQAMIATADTIEQLIYKNRLRRA